MLGNVLGLVTTASLLAVTLLSPTSALSAQVCSEPVKEALVPCLCTENTVAIHCGKDAVGYGDLTPIFHRLSLLIDDNFVFERLSISLQEMSHLPANFLGSLKFREMRIDDNKNLSWIHPDAFNSTYETTRLLDLSYNALMSTKENTDLFKALSKFTNLETFDFYVNDISYIPDDPFPQPMPKLERFIMNNNKLDYLGARFFANLPALKLAQFGSVGLDVDEISPLAFEGIGPNVALILQGNQFDSLPESIFGPVLKHAKVLFIGREVCGWLYCNRTRLACDERIDWICKDVDVYEPKLDGYYCKLTWDSPWPNTIWQYCDAHNNNSKSPRMILG